MIRLVVATGIPAVDTFLQQLPVEVIHQAQQREGVTSYLSEAPDRLPDYLIAGEPLPGSPAGLEFVLAIRRYWPDVRVIWLARDGFGADEHATLSEASISCLVGQFTDTELRGLLGLEVPAQPAPMEAPPEAPVTRQTITVWSPKSEGATTVALHLARILARNHQTLLMDLNLRRPSVGEFYRKENLSDRSLDAVWPMLQSGALTSEYLRGTVWQDKQKHAPAVLTGTTTPEFATRYGIGPVASLLKVAGEGFARTVVDVGADLDNAATEAALTHADAVLVVLRGTWFSIKAYQSARDLLQRLDVDMGRARILLYRRPGDPYSAADVEAACRAPVVGTVPHVEELDECLALGEYVQGRSRQARECLQTLQAIADAADLVQWTGVVA